MRLTTPTVADKKQLSTLAKHHTNGPILAAAHQVESLGMVDERQVVCDERP